MSGPFVVGAACDKQILCEDDRKRSKSKKQVSCEDDRKKSRAELLDADGVGFFVEVVAFVAGVFAVEEALEEA
jgi:hypothetical protein